MAQQVILIKGETCQKLTPLTSVNLMTDELTGVLYDLNKPRMLWTYHKPQWIVSRPTWSSEGPLSSCLLSGWTSLRPRTVSPVRVYWAVRPQRIIQMWRFWNAESLLPVPPVKKLLIRLTIFSDSVSAGHQEGRNHRSHYELHTGLQMPTAPSCYREYFGI